MHGNIETAFIGRLGQDPELRASAAGKSWTRVSVAVGVGDEAQWVSVAVFGEAAERLCAALQKGDKVYVEGTLRLSEWTGKGGEKRTSPPGRQRSSAPFGRNKPSKARATHAEAADTPAVGSSGQADQRCADTVLSRCGRWLGV